MMETAAMKEISEVLRYGSDLVIHYKDPKETPFTVDRLMGGISWPMQESRGYYYIFGKCRQIKKARRMVILLREVESENLNDLFEPLIEDAQKLQCSRFLADSNQGGESGRTDFIRAADEYLSQRGASVRIYPAMSMGWQVAIFKIQQWAQDGCLTIPKERTLGRQLGAMTKESLKEDRRADFYAVNALGNLIREFETQPADLSGIRSEMPASVWC
jgi:hypothetical protein